MPCRLVTAATLAAFFMIPSSGSAQVLVQRPLEEDVPAAAAVVAALARVSPRLEQRPANATSNGKSHSFNDSLESPRPWDG